MIALPTQQEIVNLLPYLTADEQAEIALLTDSLQLSYVPDFSIYADDPVRFGMEVFGEMYTEDVQAVMRSVRDNPVTIAESSNAVGKTHAAGRIATWWYKTREGAQVYTAAAPPLENLEKLLWGEIGYLTSNFPEVFDEDRVNYLNIGRNPREFVTGVAIPASGTPAQREAKFSGKHAPNLLFILDEADAIPPEVYSGIESCLSGGVGRLLCMYNPRSNEGPIAAMKERGVPVIRLSAFNHPNVISGRDVIPGAVTRNKTIHRIQKWTVPRDMEGVAGLGRFTVPEFLVGEVGKDEETGEPFPPLPGGERIIIEPEFSYMVLGEYPGLTQGVIFDVWLDDYDEAMRDGRAPQGNVTEAAEYEPDAGDVIWSIDDGYAGSVNPQTRLPTPDSHPRVIGMYQVKPNGDVCRFDELWKLREPRAEVQIQEALAKGYPPPEFVVVGPGSAALGGLLTQEGFYKRTCMANVEESIKIARQWLSQDENGHRRVKVHPRCKLLRYEMPRYRRDDLGRIMKQYDHAADEFRYLAFIGRNGFY